MNESEVVVLTRDCFAFMVPSGARMMLHQGTEVVITQSLGNSYTINVFGNLARIEGPDADALGKEPSLALVDLPIDASVQEKIWAQLKTVYDPEIPVNIVELGLIYDCQLIERDAQDYCVNIVMTLTAPGCGMGPVIADDVKRRILMIAQVSEANVEIVFEPPWSHDKLSDAAKLELGMFY